MSIPALGMGGMVVLGDRQRRSPDLPHGAFLMHQRHSDEDPLTLAYSWAALHALFDPDKAVNLLIHVYQTEVRTIYRGRLTIRIGPDELWVGNRDLLPEFIALEGKKCQIVLADDDRMAHLTASYYTPPILVQCVGYAKIPPILPRAVRHTLWIEGEE